MNEQATKKRRINEKEYPNWKELEDGGRLYWKDIAAGDKSGKLARYEKTVNKDDQTISFVQKVFDKIGQLIEIHEKFPIDKGHQILILLLLIFVGVLTYHFV